MDSRMNLINTVSARIDCKGQAHIIELHAGMLDNQARCGVVLEFEKNVITTWPQNWIAEPEREFWCQVCLKASNGD